MLTSWYYVRKNIYKTDTQIKFHYVSTWSVRNMKITWIYKHGWQGCVQKGLCAIRLGYVEGHLWHSTPDIKAADSQPQNINRIHIQPVCFSIVQRIPGRTSCLFMLFVLYLIIPFNVWIFGFLSWSKYIQCPKFELIGRLNIRHLKPVVITHLRHITPMNLLWNLIFSDYPQ